MKGNAAFFDAVEIVKSATDATSGSIQVPMVMTKERTPISPETSVKILNITTQNITPLAGDSVEILNLTAESIYSLPDASLDVYGDIVFNGAVGVNGDLVVNPDNSIKVKNIDPVENRTSVQVGGDLRIDLSKIFLVDSITPHPHSDQPMRVQVNGDLSVGSSDLHAENVNRNLHVKTKYLEATAGATDNQTGVSSD